MIRELTIEELAEDAFLKAERVKMLEIMNTPTDFDERKKAFVELAVARAAANAAESLLIRVIDGKNRRIGDASETISVVNK